MDIHDLRIFNRVAEVLSITAAGNEFQVSPGTISKKLKALEAEVGAQLIERSTRSSRLTDEGRAFLPYARRMVAEADAAVGAVLENGANVRGRLKVSVPKSIGGVDIALCIASFLEENPGIEMQVDLSSRYVNLQEEGYDVAIRTGALADSTLMARRIGDDPLVIAAAPSYLAAHPKPRYPKDLENHSCLIVGDQWRWQFKRGTKSHKVRVEGRVRGNDASLLLRCAIAGCGVVRIPRSLAHEALCDGRLVELLGGYDMSEDSGVWAVYPNTKYVPARLRSFVDFAATWLKQNNARADDIGAEAVVKAGDAARAIEQRTKALRARGAKNAPFKTTKRSGRNLPAPRS